VIFIYPKQTIRYESCSHGIFSSTDMMFSQYIYIFPTNKNKQKTRQKTTTGGKCECYDPSSKVMHCLISTAMNFMEKPNKNIM
jgi:hypothetical protein